MISNVTVEAMGPGLIITQEHISQMKGNKCNGYITMDPRDFLDLTVSSTHERQRIIQEAKTVQEYNDWARSGQNILPPWLDIELKAKPIGKIIGHEGRHRAGALIKAKINKMHVFLVAKIHRYSEWKVPQFPGDKNKRYEYRYIDKRDFPKYAIGQYLPYRVDLPLDTWVPIRDDH